MNNCLQSLNQMTMDSNASDIDNKQTENLSLLDLLNIEPDIIIEIFTHLNLKDRVSLAMTCSKLEDLLMSQLKLLENIQSCWLQDDEIMSESSSLLYRKSFNCKLDFNFDITEPVPIDVLAALTPIMKGLRIKWMKTRVVDYRLPSRMRPEKLIEILPMFTNLVHLELLTGHFNRNNIPQFNRETMPAAIIAFRNLQYLKINFKLFVALHSRFVDFSQSLQLRSFELTRGVGIEFGDNLQDRQNAAFPMLRRLISSLNQLNILKFDFPSCILMLDDFFIINNLLTEFALIEPIYKEFSTLVSQKSQDHLMEIFASQSELTLSKFHFRVNLPITLKTRTYLASKLDLSFTRLTFNIKKDEIGFFLNKYLFVPVSELYHIFRKTLQPNLAVIEINFILNEFMSGAIWLIESVCKKYPNLIRLMINQKDSNCLLTMHKGFSAPEIPCCAHLSNLQHLETFVIECDSIGTSLRNVTIESLRQFKLECYQSYDLVDELQRFLGRHKMLAHMTLNLVPSPPTWSHSIEKQKQDLMNVLHFTIKNMKGLTWCYSSDYHSLDQSEREELWNLIKKHQTDDFELNIGRGDYNDHMSLKFKITVNRVEIF